MILKTAAVVWLLFVAFIAGVATDRLRFSAQREAVVAGLEAQKAALRERLMALETAPPKGKPACPELAQKMRVLWDRQEALADFYGTGPRLEGWNE